MSQRSNIDGSDQRKVFAWLPVAIGCAVLATVLLTILFAVKDVIRQRDL